MLMKNKSILRTSTLLIFIALSNYVHAAQEPQNCTATIAAFLMATVALHIIDHSTSPSALPYVCDISDVCAPGNSPHSTVYCGKVERKNCYNRETFLEWKEDGKAYIVYSPTAYCAGAWKPLKEYEESRQKKTFSSNHQKSKHQIRFSGPKIHGNDN